MAKILVTGATGFVGRHLVPALVAQGHTVRAAVSSPVDWLPVEQVLTGRLEEQTDWSEALAGMDTVIHLAARVHIMKDTSANPSDAYLKSNAEATRLLAEQAAASQIKRFIFMSSIKVNGESTQTDKPFTEEDSPKPEDPYGQSKWLAEQYLQETGRRTGMEWTVLRPPLVYGPGVRANFLKMMQLANKGWPLPFGQVKNRRSFIYVDNLVSAITAVVEDPRAANHLFLVADQQALSLTQLLELMAAGMNKTARFLPLPAGFVQSLFRVLGLKGLSTRLFSSLELNTGKIQRQLDWKAPVSTAAGLEATAAWYLSL